MNGTPVVVDLETTAITLAQPPASAATLTPLPVFTGSEMTRALTAYRELQQALDRAMPDQIMQLDGKPYRKKGYWRALAVAFNLTVEPVEERREDYGGTYVYVVTYRASTASGRAAIGDGACSAEEKARGRMKATEHNVRAHAHTRAFNRAISNLVGFGEVSAEEVEREERPAPPPKAPALLVKPAGYSDWLDLLTPIARQGTKALEKAWNDSPREYRYYLTKTAPTTWADLKRKAEGVQ